MELSAAEREQWDLSVHEMEMSTDPKVQAEIAELATISNLEAYARGVHDGRVSTEQSIIGLLQILIDDQEANEDEGGSRLTAFALKAQQGMIRSGSHLDLDGTRVRLAAARQSMAPLLGLIRGMREGNA